MAIQRRKDNNNRVLKEGEYQRTSGTYEFKWRDKHGDRHSISAKTLEELREKELDVLRDVLDGVSVKKNNLTINDLYYSWVQLKRGLKDNTFSNYKYMYTQFVMPEFGKNKIVELKRSDVRAFYNMLADERHIRVNTIDSLHTVLHQVLELGVEDDYLRYNPSDNALKELKKAHNMENEKRRALTVKERTLLLLLTKSIPIIRRRQSLSLMLLQLKISFVSAQLLSKTIDMNFMKLMSWMLLMKGLLPRRFM